MIVEEGYVVCDIRITYKKALGGFVKRVFPLIYLRDKGFMAEFFTKIKKMYDDDFNDFLEKYKDRLDYSKVGKKLRHYQLETIYRCIHSKSKLLALDMGTGKCNPLYTKILTPNGVQTMGDMKVGSEVFGSDGEVHKVTGVFPQGLKDVYRLHLSDGTTTDCGLEHLWIVIRISDDSKSRVVLTTEQLMLEDESNFEIPIHEPIEVSDEFVLENFDLLEKLNYDINEKYSRTKCMISAPKGLVRNILRIEKLDKPVEQQCISVDSPDHSYLIDDFIVTHNTISSASISKAIAAPRTCIIGPALVKWNWYEDMVSWGYNNLYWTILEALKHKSMFAIKERFIVLNYEVVDKYKSEVNKASIDSFIIDECHKIKNTTTKAFKNIYALTKQHPKAKVILLSGTPWTNRVTDLFAYLKVAGHPLGNNKKKFEDMYAVKNGTKIIGTKNIDDLKLKISNFMIRLKSDDVLELPRLSIHKTYFNIGELNEDYKNVLGELQGIRDEYDKAEEDKKKEFNLKAKIRQSISSLSRITSMSKIPQVVQWVNSMVEQNEKVIIFSSWRGVLEELEKCFGASNCVRVDGSVESKKRQELVNIFNDEKGGVDIFLGQVKAAGVGINLVSSRTVVLMDIPISPDLIEQPIKRAHRSGQKRPVNAYFTFAKGTIDERLYSLIQEKAGDINAIIDADTKKGVVKYEEIPEMLFRELTVEHSNTSFNVSVEQSKVNESNLVIE